MKKIKLEYGNLKDCFKKEKSVIHFISDIINHRFMKAKPESKKFNNHTLKIYFDNKGIEKVNIQSILHKVKDAIPSNFTNQSPPTVIFTRSPSIGSKIFNYKQVVDNIKAKEWKSIDNHCDCSNSSFIDPSHGHIVTGNLNIVKN